MSYDSIIVGGRCAGAATALQLARRGRRVLVLERSRFPSDVLSGHTIQAAGVARLARWGVLDRLYATGVPFCDRIRFDFGDTVLDGTPAAVDGTDVAVCIRRTVIDPILADAALEAGAEFRFGTRVTELIRDEQRVIGVRGHDAAGQPFEALAPIVVGADGVNSFVARQVAAPFERIEPATTLAVYSYWSGIDLDHIELASRPGAFFIAAPTNDGLVFLAQQVPIHRADDYRSDLVHQFDATLASAPHLVDMVGQGRRAERFRFAPSHDGFIRRSHGPGWALVGDAGYHKDPITAQGMLDAFRDAEALSRAVDEGLDDHDQGLARSLAEYQHERDAAVTPMFEFTCGLADLETPPPAEVQQLIRELEHRPHGIGRFLGVIAGSVSVPEFFDPDHLRSLLDTAA